MPDAEALLWLTDRVGQELHFEVIFTRNRGRIFAAITGDGILMRHWQEGWYVVGEETRFDSTDLDASIRRRHDSELVLEFADGVSSR
jgi:hypothetical protein